MDNKIKLFYDVLDINVHQYFHYNIVDKILNRIEYNEQYKLEIELMYSDVIYEFKELLKMNKNNKIIDIIKEKFKLSKFNKLKWDNKSKKIIKYETNYIWDNGLYNWDYGNNGIFKCIFHNGIKCISY